MDDLSTKMSRGAVKMLTWRVIDRVIGLASTIVLARLLIPSDFGVVALAMSIIAVIQLLKSFSFETAIIQNREATREHFDTAWTLNVLFGAAGCACLALLAYPSAIAFDEPRLKAVMLTLAPTMLLQGLSNTGVVNFQKNLEFGKDFNFLVLKRVLTFAVTLALAFLFRNYWALIAGALMGSILGVIISFRVHPYRPRICLKAKGDLISFSKWLLLNNVIYFVVHRSTHFLIARIGGAGQLGLYTVAHEIGSLPASDMVAPINRVAYPGYALRSSNHHELGDIFLKVMSLVAAVALPVTAMLCLFADGVVAVFLGDKWSEAVPLVQVLAAAGGVSAISSNTGYVLLAINKAKTLSMIATMQAVLVILLSAAGMLWGGVLGACVGLFAASVAATGAAFAISFRLLGVSFNRYAGLIWRSAVGVIGMMAVVNLTSDLFPPSANEMEHAIRLCVLGVTGMLVHASIVFGLWILGGRRNGPEQFAWDRYRQLISARA